MKLLYTFLLIILRGFCFAQEFFNPANSGYVLIWQDEFDQNGKVDSVRWSFESGYWRKRG
ncbi:hypothetical protein [Algoriphagus sp.]|uniref:hypothetical protein n=1 Tax=Algoriphagus sp. TaxID=1872435 RepID=UPI003919E8C2